MGGSATPPLNPSAPSTALSTALIRSIDARRGAASPDPGAIGTARGWPRVIVLGLIMFSSFVNLLIPIERGFPYVPIGPANVPLPVFLNLVAFFAIFAVRPIRTLRAFRHPPLFWQAVVAGIFLVRGVLSPEAGKGIATAVIYTGTWVAQFALMLSVLKWVGRPAFARAYLWMAAIAAILGILEGLFGFLLPPYQLVRLVYAIAKGYGELNGSRVDGPPGNSIIFAFQMALSVPFAFEIRSRPVRWGLIGLFVLAVVLSIARIGYLMLLIIAMGGLLLGGKRANTAAMVLGSLVLAVVVLATVIPDNPVVARIGSRFSGRGEASENVRFRTEAIRLSIGRTVDDGRIDVALWGAGIRAGDKIGENLSTGTTTLDNAYATLVYEGGFLLLGSYLVAHSFHVRRLWRGYGPARLYWFAMGAALVGGVAFASPYSAVANFPFVATLAVLGHERIVRTPPKRRRVVARPVAELTPGSPA